MHPRPSERRRGRHPETAGRVVEVGCGSGTLARQPRRRGVRRLGFDISPAMIRLAREKAPAGEFRVASLTEARTAALPRRRGDRRGRRLRARQRPAPRSRRRCAILLARARGARSRAACFIFDFIESGVRRTYRRQSQSGADWVLAVHADLDHTRARSLTRRMVTIRKVGRAVPADSQETHRVQIYGRRAMAQALADRRLHLAHVAALWTDRLMPVASR